MPHMPGRRQGNAMVMEIVADEPITGLWCPTCFKPSGIEVVVHAMCEEHGSHLFATLRICQDCQTRLPKPDAGDD